VSPGWIVLLALDEVHSIYPVCAAIKRERERDKSIRAMLAWLVNSMVGVGAKSNKLD